MDTIAVNAGNEPDGQEKWLMRLYIAGQTPKSVKALANLRKICETHLAGNYAIEVVDLTVHPERGRGDQIFAIPTLVRQLPPPLVKIIGDLSNTEKVLVGLSISPGNAARRREGWVREPPRLAMVKQAQDRRTAAFCIYSSPDRRSARSAPSPM